MLWIPLAALLLAGCSSPHAPTVLHAAPNGSTLPTLREALSLAAACARSRILLQPGLHRIAEPLHLPKGCTLQGRGVATVSGGVDIGPWEPVPETPWLFAAALPAGLGWHRGVYQLFVDGQRRGVARSATMRFSKVSSTGLEVAPGQILGHYANQSALRCVTYQHWTAAIQRVLSANASSNQITLEHTPDPMTGDKGSGSRYYLENAPEYLRPGSGTFYAEQHRIVYSPLAGDEAARFSRSPQPKVIAPRPGLYELIRSNDTHDVRIDGVNFAHTDVEMEECLAGGCAGQSVSWLDKAALHFEASSRLHLVNVSIQHVGGHALWFGAGVSNASCTHSLIHDLAAGGVRIGGPYRGDQAIKLNKTATNVTLSDTVIKDGGNLFRFGGESASFFVNVLNL